MNEISIENLLRTVYNSLDQQEQKKSLNLLKRVKHLQKYSIDKGLTTVVRIPVTPTIVKNEVILGKGTYNKWTDETSYLTEEQKIYTVEEQNIVKAIKTIYPDHVENRIFFFDKGKYYFTTDKGLPYNLRRIPRQLTKDEKKKIQELIEEVEDNKKQVEVVLNEARIIQAIVTPDICRSEEQRELANSCEAILITLKLNKEIEKTYRNFKFNNGKNLYGETALEEVAKRLLNDAVKTKEEHLEMLRKSLTKIEELFNKCEEEPEFFIHPLKQNKQLKIYTSKINKNRYETLGYKLYEVESEETTYRHNEVKGSILLEETTYNKTSYYIQMAHKAFTTSCYHGKVCKSGYYFDTNGNEVKLISNRPCEEVTLKDEYGNILTFTSKTEAAKHFNTTNSKISEILKNASNGKIPTVTIKPLKNSKGFTLITGSGELLEFVSMSEAARILNTTILKISRALKNKVSGDTVKINKIDYTLK